MSMIIAGGLTNTPTDPALFGGATPEQVAAAVAEYIAKNPVNAPSAEQIASAVEEYLKNNPSGGGGDADTLDGKHASDFAPAVHTHSYNDLKDTPTIPTIPSSLPADGGNADTVGGKTAEQIQQAAEETIPTAVNTALQAAKESGEFNGKSPVIEMSGTAEGTILRVVNADGGEEEVLIRDGKDGEPGLHGLSAYQIAVQQGFVGTAVQWLDSLVGQNGISVTKAEINASGQLVLTFSNGQTANVGKVVGTNGTNGTSPVVSVSAITGGNRITITDVNGTKTIDVLNGSKGNDGTSPTVNVSKSGKVTTISITDKNGTKTTTINDGSDGKTPAKGVDYFTPSEVSDIVQQVLDALGGNPVFGVVDANNNIVLSGNLAEGVYTLKYEDADGKVTEIGTLNHTNAPEVTYTNLFVPGTASLNTRMSGSSSTSKAQDGYVMTAEIQLPAPVVVSGSYDDTTPYVLVPDGMWSGSANIFGKDANGQFSVFMDAGSTPGTTVGVWKKVPLRDQWASGQKTISSMILSLYVKSSAISATDVQGIEVYYNEIPE